MQDLWEATYYMTTRTGNTNKHARIGEEAGQT